MPSQENFESSPGSGTVPEVQIELPDSNANLPESSELEHLMADMEKVAPPQGEIVQGKVLKVTDTEILVDIGLKMEAAIPRLEFAGEDGEVHVAPGDLVDVWVEHVDETEGTVTVSRVKAARLRAWEEIDNAFREKKTLTGRVLQRVKGGLAVDIGVKAFLPASHTDLRPLRNLESLIGQEIPCKVLNYTRKRNNVVVSRKAALEDEAQRRKGELLAKLQEGAELLGRVKNLTEYGAFLDLGGVDGLLHITDMSWARVAHPSEVVQVGQEIKVRILKFDAEKGRVSLGLKQLLPDPWAEVPEKYRVGDRASGRVVSITDYGAFVELQQGVEGLLHVSEMSWSRRMKHPSKVLKVNERVEVVILDIKPAERRLSLSLRRTLPDPWVTLADRFQVGAEVEAQVRNLAEFGAFVEIEPGIEGLIHVSDLSWTRKVKHPSEVVKKGQRITAVILKIDSEHRRLSLGLKQLEPDPWEMFIRTTKVGDRVRGKVVRLAPFGAFVELQEGIECLCHNSEMPQGEGSDGEAKVEVNSEREFRVIRLNSSEKKIGLSLKETARAASSGTAEKPPDSITTMAAALSSAGITAQSAFPAAPAPPDGSGPASGGEGS
jgi:small subunit ribosomal protein S1